MLIKHKKCIIGPPAGVQGCWKSFEYGKEYFQGIKIFFFKKWQKYFRDFPISDKIVRDNADMPWNCQKCSKKIVKGQISQKLEKLESRCLNFLKIFFVDGLILNFETLRLIDTLSRHVYYYYLLPRKQNKRSTFEFWKFKNYQWPTE